ncbi:piggybac transposable element-derived protein 4 [Holotrichia oblita]|uniref:Piggybac transposable element-derived protein 4 n=1 Tax=Holotrichia oblita TaxID=644536 RepID=A0ACB9T6F4_HOLOL|nr:piggybac transposable element-derived protein 4 [Holotrichia oblita]
MLNRTARILKAAAAQKTAPSSSSSHFSKNPVQNNSVLLAPPSETQDAEKITAHLPSSGEESEPFPGSESSYQPSESDIQNNTSDDSDAETSGSDVNNQPVTDPVNPAVTNNETWGPCGIVSNSFPFTGESGFQFNPTDFRDPYKIYRLFIDDEVLEIIVRETNRYADQFIQSNDLSRRSFVRQWTETNKEEIRKFLGILVIMGMNHLPKMRLYWSKNPMFRNDLICKNMTRTRFDLLLKFIHFSDNEQNRRNPDRLAKVKEVLDCIQKNFQNALKPEKALVIDETMVPWRGRLVFRQYLPAKSHPYGIKVYKLCTIDLLW